MVGIKAGRKLAAIITNKFSHRMRIYLRSKDGDRNVFANLHIRILSAADWKTLHERDRAKDKVDDLPRMRWSSAELPGGMVLAVKVEDRHWASQEQDELYPERTVEMKKLRNILIDALDRHRDQFGSVDCHIGAEGGAEFDIELEAGQSHPTDAKIVLRNLEDGD